MSKKDSTKEYCNGCHHMMRLHYFNRAGVSCGRCKPDNVIHWSDKTGRPCRKCDHLEALHFLSGPCRIVGCDCKRFRES